MLYKVHPPAMKFQIAFLGSAAVSSRSGGKVVVPWFRSLPRGFAFEQSCFETLVAAFP
jgi:hypothetical protein